MIVGHGIDLQEIDAIMRVYQKNANFAKKILTAEEWQRFSQLKSEKRQMEYLAGRWAGKEAFSKAFGTGIGKVGFQDIEILSNELGAPIITKTPFEGECFISLSHSGNLVMASVILEERQSELEK